MAPALFVVRMSVAPGREAEFNEWYNGEHCPEVLQFRGAVSARRYRKARGDDPQQYMAVYEFQDEQTLESFRSSEYSRELRKKRQARFQLEAEPTRTGYVQVWP